VKCREAEVGSTCRVARDWRIGIAAGILLPHLPGRQAVRQAGNRQRRRYELIALAEHPSQALPLRRQAAAEAGRQAGRQDPPPPPSSFLGTETAAENGGFYVLQVTPHQPSTSHGVSSVKVW